MKKTLTANISGTVFHIEEDAYDKLQRYLGTIRDQFAGTEGRDEIMADIEARIAELFQESLDGKRQVVSTDDVDHVIGIMGQPEDYMGEEEAPAAGDPGTAAGAGQPNWAYPGGRKHKRLMRDTEDRWVGGVLSGIAAYFGVDPLILRLIYIILLLVGIGWLIYIILWIVVPPAETAADKLEMRGEPITVENLKRVFDEGSERFKAGTERAAKEAGDLGKRWSGPEARAQQEYYRASAARGVSSAVRVLGKLFGLFLLVIGVSMGMMLLASLIGGTVVGDGGTGSFELGALLFATGSQAMWFVIAVILLALIPIIGLILAGLRLVFGLRSPKWFTASLGIIWFVVLFVAFGLGIRLGSDFAQSEPLREELPLVQPAGQVLHLSNMDPGSDVKRWEFEFYNGHVEWDGEGLMTTADSIHGSWAELDVRRSPDSLFHVIVERSAQGRSSKASLVRASHITYTTDQRDSLVLFSPWVNFPKEDKIRAQGVRFIVQVPVGKAVHFSETMGFLLDDVKNVTNTWDRDMVGRTWTMTPAGLEGDTAPEAEPDTLTIVHPTTSSNGTKGTTTVKVSTKRVASMADVPGEEQVATVFRGPVKRKTTAVTTEQRAHYVLPSVFELIFHRI